MSSYPPPKNNGLGIYNPSSFVGVSDVGGTTKLVLDLGNYVRSDAGIFTGNIQTSGSLVLNNQTQNVAFTDAKNSDLVNVKTKTEDIAYSNNQTTIGGDLQVSGNLLINDNNLTISKISGLQTKLNEIDVNFNNITSNDTELAILNTFKTNQELYNDVNDTNITDIETVNLTQNGRLDTLETFKTGQETYNSTNDTLNSTQNGRLNTLETFKTSQETYNSTNDTLNSTQNGRLNTLEIFKTSQETYNVSNDTNILNLQNKDTSQDTIINGILTSINNLESADITLQDNITNNDNDITSLNTSISSINTTLSNHTTSINNLDTLTTSQTTNLNTLNTFKTNQELYNTNNDTLTASHTSSINQNTNDISTNTTNINLKQNIINSSNRLNASHIADGSVSNLQYQTLAGINTSSSIESRLTSLNNALNSLNIDVDTLENLQNIDLTNFSNIGTQISNIESDITDLETNVNSNIGRLNINEESITTMNTTLTAHSNSITQNSSDIGTLQGEMTTAQADILTKHDIIDTDNKLSSSLVSTNVNETPSTLDVVLQSLRDVNDTQSTSISNIITSITNLTNDIASNDTEILALQNQDTNHTNLITTLQGEMTTAQADILTKHDIIDTNNKLNSNLVYDSTEDDTINNIIVRIDNDIATKQNIINNTDNKLPADHLDLTGSNLIYADYGSSINAKFASLDGQISTLTTLQDGDVANFTAIDDNFTVVEGNITNLQNAIIKVPYLDNVVSDVQGQIDGLISSNLPSLTYDSPTTTTTIANNTNLTTLIFNGDSSQQTTAFTDAKNTELSTATTNISTLQSEMTTAQTDIMNNTNDINTKQNIINNTDSKLPADHLDLTGSNLLFADYGSSINTKFTNIDTTLSNQATLNTSISNDISSLNSNKQNTLSSGNKLNPQFIECSGAGELTSTKTQYLSSIDAVIATKFSNKADVNNQTFTGTITIPNLTLTNSLFTSLISEKVSTSWTSFSSNILTVNMSLSPIVYFTGLTSNTNFKLALTNVATDTNRTQTFTLIISTSSYKAFANTFSLNGGNQTLIINGGLANVDVSSVSTSGLIVQQFTMIYTGSFQKVISNVSLFY